MATGTFRILQYLSRKLNEVAERHILSSAKKGLIKKLRASDIPIIETESVRSWRQGGFTTGVVVPNEYLNKPSLRDIIDDIRKRYSVSVVEQDADFMRNRFLGLYNEGKVSDLLVF